MHVLSCQVWKGKFHFGVLGLASFFLERERMQSASPCVDNQNSAKRTSFTKLKFMGFVLVWFGFIMKKLFMCFKLLSQTFCSWSNILWINVEICMGVQWLGFYNYVTQFFNFSIAVPINSKMVKLDVPVLRSPLLDSMVLNRLQRLKSRDPDSEFKTRTWWKKSLFISQLRIYDPLEFQVPSLE